MRLRYYPPEKQGLRQDLLTLPHTSPQLRYYPPEKQGLRLLYLYGYRECRQPQILSSRKTRIKTEFPVSRDHVDVPSDTILQKNKD